MMVIYIDYYNFINTCTGIYYIYNLQNKLLGQVLEYNIVKGCKLRQRNLF